MYKFKTLSGVLFAFLLGCSANTYTDEAQTTEDTASDEVMSLVPDLNADLTITCWNGQNCSVCCGGGYCCISCATGGTNCFSE